MILLETYLVRLLETCSGRSASPTELQRIAQLLAENGFDRPSDTPDWFLHILDQLVEARSSEGFVKYDHSDGKGDVTNLLAELERIIPASWDDYGEALEATFPNGCHLYLGRIDDVWSVSTK